MAAAQSLPQKPRWRTLRQPKQHGTLLDHYPPLREEPVHIRLVKFLPFRSWHDSDLRCELRDVELSSEEKYWALSYEWVPIDEGYDLFVKTQLGTLVIKIRKNLRDFVRRVRNNSAFQDKWLWIDQICINQQSNDEKSHQVLHMRSIYRTASRTIVWIHSAPLMMYLGLGRFGFWFKRPALPIKRDRVHAILESSYWRRVWIIQEVVLSQSIHFMTPTHTTDLTSLESYKCFDKLYRSHLHFWGFAAFKSIVELRHLQDSGLREIKSWKRALLYSNQSVASIPADRVYALLGLMQPKLLINPDYTASRPNIFMRVSMVEIVHGPDYQEPNAQENNADRFLLVQFSLGQALGVKDHISASIIPSCMVFGFWLREQHISNQEGLNVPALDLFVRVCIEVACLLGGHDGARVPGFHSQKIQIQQSWYPFQWLCQELGIMLDDAMLTRLKPLKDLCTREDDSWFKANNTAGSDLRDMLESLAYQTEGLEAAVARLREEQGFERSPPKPRATTIIDTKDEASAG